MPVRVGLVGGGFGLHTVLPVIRSAGGEVSAFCHPDPTRAKAGAVGAGIPGWVTSTRSLARRLDVDLVWIASPPAHHYSDAIACLEHGKPVICEKPLATSLREAKAMARIADERGLLNILDHEFRIAARRRLVKEILDAGRLGRILSVAIVDLSSDFSDPNARESAWWLRREAGGGQLGAVGSHWLDTVRWWFGSTRILGSQLLTSQRQRLARDGGEVDVTADDTFAVFLGINDEGSGVIQCSRAAAQTFCEVRIVGQQGSIVLGNGGDLRLQTDEKKNQVLIPASAGVRISGVTEDEQKTALAAVFLFAAHRLGQGPRSDEIDNLPIATFLDGEQVQAQLDAAYSLAGVG